MPFIRNFEDDPLKERVYSLIYGPPKIGKTYAVLDLIKKHGDYVVMLSFDRGDFAVRQDPETYKGKMVRANPATLGEIRDDLKEAGFIVNKLAKKGIPRSSIWLVMDTMTHAQTILLAEARKINIKNPHTRDGRTEYVRDATTQVDYMVNLGHMNEIADALASMKCNVIVITLEKNEILHGRRDKTSNMIPALSGQAYTRFLGDADVILRMVEEKGERYFSLSGQSGSCVGGDRSGKLDIREPADIKHIQQKMLGAKQAKKTEPKAQQNDEASQVTA